MFSVVYKTETGRILYQGGFGPDHPVAEGEAIVTFDAWADTAGMAIDHETRTLVPSSRDNRTVRGSSWDVVREDRNRRLSDTDYLMTIDYPISDESRRRVAAYRKELRDLPINFRDTSKIVWPVMPSLD